MWGGLGNEFLFWEETTAITLVGFVVLSNLVACKIFIAIAVFNFIELGNRIILYDFAFVKNTIKFFQNNSTVWMYDSWSQE